MEGASASDGLLAEALGHGIRRFINLLLAISWVAVIVVLLTQLISDIGYAYLNPRIRVK